MFDTINKKLEDESFIASATQVTTVKKNKKNKGDKDDKDDEDKDDDNDKDDKDTDEKNHKKWSTNSEAGMNDADVACYQARYSDLGQTDPREHFMTVGIKQGRVGTCAPELTEMEA